MSKETLDIREKLLELIGYAVKKEAAKSCYGGADPVLAGFCGLSIYRDPKQTRQTTPTQRDDTFYRWQQCPHPFDVCGYGDEDIMEVLLGHGFDVNKAAASAPPLFSHAVSREFTDFLVEHGADVNKTYQYRTPLLYLLSDDFKPCEAFSYAVSPQEILSACDYLVEHGADMNAVGPDGVSARELYERMKARYQRELDNEPDWEAVSRQEEERKDRRSLQELLNQYGGDEDAMHNSPEYWDYMEGLPDSD